MVSHNPLRILTAGAVVTLVGAACAPASLQRDVLRHDLGRGTRGDIELVIPEMLIRAGYAMALRRDTGALLYYETAWHVRQPFEDEADQCARECRSRIIVEARRQGGDLYSVSLRAENSSLTGASTENPSGGAVWTPILPSPQFRDHVSELSSAIGMRIDAGVRVFRP
jgi:hypothetical protein